MGQLLGVDVGLSNGQKVLCTSVIFRNITMGNKMRGLHFTSFDRKTSVGRDSVQWHHKSPAVRERGEVRRPP